MTRFFNSWGKKSTKHADDRPPILFAIAFHGKWCPSNREIVEANVVNHMIHLQSHPFLVMLGVEYHSDCMNHLTCFQTNENRQLTVFILGRTWIEHIVVVDIPVLAD